MLTHLNSLINSQNSYEVPTICNKTNSSFKHRYALMIQYDMEELTYESDK